MAELPACRMHNPVIPSLSPTVATCYICFQSPENSQLVILYQLWFLILHFSGYPLPVMVFNPAFFSLDYLFQLLFGDECLQISVAG